MTAMSSLAYEAFLATKEAPPPPAGFRIDAADLHQSLFPFQRDIVRGAVALGRAAIFADTGLGKSRMMLEWMRQIARQTGRKVLLVCPLGVAHQFVHDEGPAIGATVAYCRSQADADAAETALICTNYEMVDRLNPDAFAAVALDEADILCNMTGAYNLLLNRMFDETAYKVVATATPAPNQLHELGRYADFLKIMPSGMMLTRYFIRDSQAAAEMRLRHWADAGPFWDWLATWAYCAGLPSDLGDGYDDSGYLLPPLEIQTHTVQVSYEAAWNQGQLFPDLKVSATGMWASKSDTAEGRCSLAAQLVAAEPAEPWVVWCSTDKESALLARAIPGAFEVKGAQTPEIKEQRLRDFAAGNIRVMVTKPRIAGMGLNWQHCARVVYCSPTFSFKYFYQALRRTWRFRQARPVHCHVVIAETEESILATVQRKHEQHREMQRKAREAMRRRRALGDDWRVLEGDLMPVDLPEWLIQLKQRSI